MKIISVKQPWAHAILHLGKDIENRKWKTKYRGVLLVHASMAADKSAPAELWDALPDETAQFGGIIGQVELVDVVTKSDSKWFQGPFGFVLKNPKPLPYKRHKGKLGITDYREEQL